MLELFIIALVLAWSLQTVFMWKRARLLRAEIVEAQRLNSELLETNADLIKSLAGARTVNAILLKSQRSEDDYTTEKPTTDWPEFIF